MRVHPFSIRGVEDADSLPPEDAATTLVLLFGDPDPDRAAPLVEAVRARYPDAHLLGCSTAGEIAGAEIRDGTLTGAVVSFERTRLASVMAPVADASDSFAAGRAIASALAAPDLRGALVLSEGLHVNGNELVRGLSSVLPPEVIVTGGLAGDGDRFERTWVLHEGRPASGAVAAVGLYGDAIQVGHGSRGGWDIFGPERRVTSSAGNVLYELDGRPALALYKEYLGDLAEGLPATALLFPLAVSADDSPEKQIVRTVLAVDEEAQSLTFAGDVPQGARAQLMRANFDRLVESASQAATLTRSATEDEGPTLSIAISCVGRRLILAERTEEELEAALESLPSNTTQVGFYSYGEISPFATGHCDLHNQTLTLTTLAERAG